MNTENTLNRAYGHWIKDGLLELGGGFLLAGVGTLRAIIHFAEDKSPSYYWLAVVLIVFMLGSGWGSKYIIEMLKERITYPRAGYTAFKRPKYNYKSIIVLFIFAGILGGVLGILSTQPNQQQIGIFIPIFGGIIVAGLFTYAAQRVEVKRFYYLAIFSVGSGLVIGVLGVGVVLGLSFFYSSIGLALVVTGSVALVQFLRENEPIDLDGES